MKTILLTAALAAGVAFCLGLLLGLFKKIFAVKVDPKVQAVQDALPGANCGGCGYAGCAGFAAAVVKGEAPANGCVAGGPSVSAKVGEILGVSVSSQKKVALLACQGLKSCSVDRGVYNGVKTCAAASMSVVGTKNCAFGCVGYGDCVSACSFGALFMGDDGLPVVDYSKCVGCGQCAKSCPKKLFKVIDAETKGPVALCSNRTDNKPSVKKNCANGCIKCGICVTKCPKKCVTLVKGIPEVDYSQCIACGICVKACPDKVLHLVKDVVN